MILRITRRAVFAIAVVLSVARTGAVAAATEPPAVATSTIAAPDAIQLARATLMSIHDANISGNYTVLRDLGSPALQRRSASELARIFAPLRARNLDLFAAALTAFQFTTPPNIGADQRLKLNGQFITRPEVITFEFAFEAVEGVWKPSSLNLMLN